VNVESDNFLAIKSSDTWMNVKNAFGFPWSWSDTSGGILVVHDTSTATTTGHVTGSGNLKVGTPPNAYRVSMNFRLSSLDSNSAEVLLSDVTKRKQYRFGINTGSTGAITPNLLTIACLSLDSNTVISETHQTISGLAINTDYQLVMMLSPVSLTGKLYQSGSLVSGIALDSSVIISFSGPVTSVSFSAGIDLKGTPSSSVFADSFSVQANYKFPGFNMWEWNDSSLIAQDTSAKEIRSVGHAAGALVQNGIRMSWRDTSSMQVSMMFKLSSVDSNAAAITVLDSVNNRRYWLVLGNNGIGQAARRELSVMVTDGGSNQVLFSQANQAIQNLSTGTYYWLGITIDDTTVSGELQLSGFSIAQTKVSFNSVWGTALFPGVDLIGTASLPVSASAFNVTILQLFSSGGGGGSCPFVYSFDGSDWAFDAEPYGGAFSKGLQRTEWCVLEHLREVDGRYFLRMTNELDETQYTDELKLVVVDHDFGVSITPDAAGKIHTIEKPVAPRSARNATGTDILSLVDKKDGRSWQSPMLRSIPAATAAERDTLEFEFPKPLAAKTVKLLINASTTPLGAEMGKRFLTMHGGLLSAWYDEIDKGGSALDRVHAWYKDQELYMLKAWVQTPRGWEARETILGSGPMAAKAKVYIINTSDIPGTILHIRLCPPTGFWSFDYIAADYSKDRKVSVHETGALAARERDGKDVRDALGACDGSYLVSEKGSSVDLSFDAPAMPRNTIRSVVLKANGWYRIHLDAKGMPRFDLLAQMNEPGFGAKYAIKEYLRLYKQIALR
jgi:hypothetical protein